MGQGYVTLHSAAGAGKWKFSDGGVLKAHFQLKMIAGFMGADETMMSMTRDELTEMQAELYRKNHKNIRSVI
ncbi:MAG: hypothetical protein COB14_06740 [Alphaproteobacteria bacterium]|nr:MAG: hypothetical protein COB14_06740 [Alphaproteobacteria bacterium]